MAGVANFNGRSGGTEVVSRRPTQIFRGGPLTRRSNAVISWTWRSCLQIGPVYTVANVDPHPTYVTGQTFAESQGCVAGLGNVPWILGGDWNIEPHEYDDDWRCSGAVLVDIETVTQKTMPNLD